MNFTGKMKTIEELTHISADLRNTGKKIVHCHGCFDLLHIGHLRYFRQAGEMGDIVVVTITPDRYVDKGPHRPAFPETLRAEAVASLDSVDYVAINQWPTAEETLRLLRPDVYVKGSDFVDDDPDPTGKLDGEMAVVSEIGAKMAFTKGVVFSSTHLINRFFSTFHADVRQYLDIFRKRYKLEGILDLLDRMMGLNVLVIGDTILDDYQYCQTIGSSSKDPVLAVKYESNELFAGGVLAVANHVAGFAGNVTLATVLGDRDRYEDHIRSRLLNNVFPHFQTQDGAPTLIKRRFIDGYSLSKLFEVYVMDDSGLPIEKDREFGTWLKRQLKNFDLVVVADFGHGALSTASRKILVDHAPFLAVNTQANAGNRGFHSVTRYARANYVSLAEHEIRLEMRDANGNIRKMVEKLATRLGCGNFVVTLGKEGCSVRNGAGRFLEVPAFAQKVVDRMGAGDAFLSVTSLAAYLGASAELIGFLGNAVGALAVEILGNQKPVNKSDLKKYITALLK